MTHNELRPEVLAFARLMEQRLREKDADKGKGWKNMGADELFTPFLAKAFAVEKCIFNTGTPATKQVIDCANFAMMIADAAGALDAGYVGGTDGNAGPGWAALDQVQMS